MLFIFVLWLLGHLLLVIISVFTCKTKIENMENIKRQSKISSEAAICRCSTKETPTQVFSCEYCEMFKNSFFLQNTCDGCFCKLQYKGLFYGKSFPTSEIFPHFNC